MIVDWLIRRAKRTPYFDIRLLGSNALYMERYWLVPYAEVSYDSRKEGVGPVTWRRPIAKIMQLLGLAARIHIIRLSDDDRALHDHPWNYLTIILRGGYWEVTDDNTRYGTIRKWHGPGSILWRRANSWHRLEVGSEPAVTVFITGKMIQNWGFRIGVRKILWRDYFRMYGPQA